MAVFDNILDTLITEIKSMTEQGGYNTDFPTPLTYGSDVVHARSHPAMTVTPNGDATIELEDASDLRMSRDIEIVAAVSEKDQEENYKAIIGLAEDLRALIYTPIDLGTNFLCIYPLEPVEEMTVLMDKAILIQRWRILYVEPDVKPGTADGTDIYGSDDVYDLALSKVYDLLNTFMLGDLASLSPKFSYLYNHHGKANLLLNAATIEIMSAESNRIGGIGTNAIFAHEVIASIRIHTAYFGGRMKTVENMRLLNSIESYLLENVDLSGGYHIDGTGDISPAQIFDDSGTLGGSMTIKISRKGDYAQ